MGRMRSCTTRLKANQIINSNPLAYTKKDTVKRAGMRLYSEIFKNINANTFARCVIVPCGSGYFEGVKGMEEFYEVLY